ncbi:MAG: thioredoxin [Polyangiaceae bacterium]
MAKGLLELDETNFEKEVLRADVPVIVEFGATWCGPCRALEPMLERLAQKSAGTRKFATINVDDSPAIATKYGVRGTPTIVVFAQGKEVARQIGLTNEAKIGAIVDRAVA